MYHVTFLFGSDNQNLGFRHQDDCIMRKHVEKPQLIPDTNESPTCYAGNGYETNGYLHRITALVQNFFIVLTLDDK